MLWVPLAKCHLPAETQVHCYEKLLLCKKSNFLLKALGSLKFPFRFCGLNEYFCFSEPQNFLIFAELSPPQTTEFSSAQNPALDLVS